MCFQVWSLLLLMDQRSDSTSRYWPSNYLKGFKNIPGGCLGFLNLSTVSFIKGSLAQKLPIYERHLSKVKSSRVESSRVESSRIVSSRVESSRVSQVE